MTSRERLYGGAAIGLWWALQFTSLVEEIPEFGVVLFSIPITRGLVVTAAYLLEAGARFVSSCRRCRQCRDDP